MHRARWKNARRDAVALPFSRDAVALRFFVPFALAVALVIGGADAAADMSQAAKDDPPRLVVRPDASSVIAESPVNFYCRADGNPLPNVQWRVNQKPVSAGGDAKFSVKSLKNGLSTLRFEAVSPADNNSRIACLADNGVGNPLLVEALLTVFAKKETPIGFPRIEAHPSIKAVEAGRTAHVTCRVDGEPRPKVLWLRDSVPLDIRADERYSISTLSNPGALMIQRASEDDQGKYECVARNALGVQHSRAAQLYVKVRRVPPYFSYKLEKTYKVGVGGSINLTCVAVGFPMPRVLWKKTGEVLDEIPLAPIGRNVLTLQNVELTENFTCIAVSKLGNIEATTTVEVKALPPAPINLRITAVTAESVSLAWDVVRLDGGEGLVKQVVKYRQRSLTTPAPDTSIAPASDSIGGGSGVYGDSSSFREHVVSPNETAATIGGLEPFQQYEFVVQSISNVGAGALSLPREAQTGEAPPSSPPLKVQAKAFQSSAIHVQWSAPEQPNGFITAYEIFCTDGARDRPLDEWKKEETRSDELQRVVRGLITDRRYFVVVRAVNSRGASPPSAVASVRVTYGLPAQPVAVTATPLDAHRVQMTWEQPIHSSPIVNYVIRYNGSGGGGGLDEDVMTSGASTKHVVGELRPLTTYAIQVAAKSARGVGEFSDAVLVTTRNGTVLSAPVLLSASAVSASALNITWSRPENADTVSRYVIRYRALPDETNVGEARDSSRSAEGTSSEEIDAGIRAVTSSSTGQPRRVTGGGGRHRKKHRKIPFLERTIAGGDDNETFSVLDGLLPYTTYEITVVAVSDVSGVGEESEMRKITTKEGGTSCVRLACLPSFA